MNVPVNYLAVVLAAVAQMILGFVWYGPLFGKTWSKMKGFDFDKMSKDEQKTMQKKMMPWYGLVFIFSLLTAYVLSHVMFLSMNFFHYTALMTGLMTGFFMWLGFLLPLHAGNTIFSLNKDWKLFSIDASYWLVGLLLMGVVISYL